MSTATDATLAEVSTNEADLLKLLDAHAAKKTADAAASEQALKDLQAKIDTEQEAINKANRQKLLKYALSMPLPFSATTNVKSDTQFVANTATTVEELPLEKDSAYDAAKIAARKITRMVDGKPVSIISIVVHMPAGNDKAAAREAHQALVKKLQEAIFADPKHADVDDIFVGGDWNENHYAAKGLVPVDDGAGKMTLNKVKPRIKQKDANGVETEIDGPETTVVELIRDRIGTSVDGAAATDPKFSNVVSVTMQDYVVQRQRGVVDAAGKFTALNMYFDQQQEKEADPVCSSKIAVYQLRRPTKMTAADTFDKTKLVLPPAANTKNFATDDLGCRDHWPVVVQVKDDKDELVGELRYSGNLGTQKPKEVLGARKIFKETSFATPADPKSSLSAAVFTDTAASTKMFYKLLTIEYLKQDNGSAYDDASFEALYATLTESKAIKAFINDKLKPAIRATDKAATYTKDNPEVMTDAEKARLKPVMKAWVESQAFKDAANHKLNSPFDLTNSDSAADYFVARAAKVGTKFTTDVITSIAEGLEAQPSAGYGSICGSSAHNNASIEEEQIESDAETLFQMAIAHPNAQVISVSTESAVAKAKDNDKGADFARKLETRVNNKLLAHMTAKFEEYMVASGPAAFAGGLTAAGNKTKREAGVRYDFLKAYKDQLDALLKPEMKLSTATVNEMMKLTKHVMVYACPEADKAQREAARDAIHVQCSTLNTRSPLAILGGIALAMIGAGLVACAVAALVISTGAALPLSLLLAKVGIVVSTTVIEATVATAAGALSLAATVPAAAFFTKPATRELALLADTYVDKNEKELALAAAPAPATP